MPDDQYINPGGQQPQDQNVQADAQAIPVQNITVEVPAEGEAPVEAPAVEATESVTPAAPAAPAAPVTEEKQQDVNKAIDRINLELKEKAVSENAKALGLPYINIVEVPINPDMLNLLDREVMTANSVLPFFRIGKKIRVAVAFPDKQETQQVLQDLRDKGFLLNINLASDLGIDAVLKNFFKEPAKKTVDVENTAVDEEKIQAFEKEIADLAAASNKIADMPAEEAVNFLCVGAIKTGASDMHFQPEEGYCQMRFRIDGMMQNIMRMDLKTYQNFLNQVKYKSKMKLNIMNEPQDGRFYFVINEQKVDVRVSLIPTEFGETIVMRLLDARKGFLSLEQLGFSEFNYTILDRLTKLSVGLILVTGPTGSGKTTSLYAMLDRINKPEVKIITLENPIEYHLEGISQSQTNEKRGYNFADGLKSILRQDPNVVMIGEIRDFDTANTTCQAALTGHLVLSTLHTNSAVESIPRMLNIGTPEFMLAPALRAVVAQRLVRVLCECKQEKEIEEGEREFLTKSVADMKSRNQIVSLEVPSTLFKPTGCEKCSNTGYKGQTQIAEILVIDEEIHDMILNKKSENDILKAALAKGMLTMQEDGIGKVLNGITTLEEIFRVTKR